MSEINGIPTISVMLLFAIIAYTVTVFTIFSCRAVLVRGLCRGERITCGVIAFFSGAVVLIFFFLGDPQIQEAMWIMVSGWLS